MQAKNPWPTLSPSFVCMIHDDYGAQNM